MRVIHGVTTGPGTGIDTIHLFEVVRSISFLEQSGQDVTHQRQKAQSCGQLGCAVIAHRANFVDFKEDSKNFLMIVKVPESRVAVYYAGFGWRRQPGDAEEDANDAGRFERDGDQT
jgi:hypothetical protein